MGHRHLDPEQRTQRKRAYDLYEAAIRRGEIIRPLGCAECPPLHGHHHLGYDHPLDVLWLCPTHHGIAHLTETQRRKRAAEIAESLG